MSTIVELQRRLHENGRIRIGHKVESRNGKMRPAKLETFRFTSRDRNLIDQCAQRWGGQLEPWDDAPGGRQYQVVTQADSIDCVVPPSSMAFTQSYEQWTAGGCKVRCNGQWDDVGDIACHCDPTDRECDIHTRLSVLLPDLRGMGVWRLDTQGYYAAVELGGVVDVLQAQAESGRLLPARLRLEQRSVKRVRNGEVVTLNFAVPILDVDLPLFAISGMRPALGNPVPPIEPSNGSVAPPALTPVPPPDDDRPPPPSLDEQLAAVDEERARSKRRVDPPPSTGLKPRTATQVAETEAPPDVHADDEPSSGEVLWMRSTLNMYGTAGRRAFLERFGCPPQEVPEAKRAEAVAFVRQLVGGGPGPAASSEPDPDPPSPTVEPVPDDEATPGFTVEEVARHASRTFAADYEAAPRGDKTKVVDRLRHALTYAAVGKTSLKDCTGVELARVWQRLEDIDAGRLTYEHDQDERAGVRFGMVGSDESETVLWSELTS